MINRGPFFRVNWRKQGLPSVASGPPTALMGFSLSPLPLCIGSSAFAPGGLLPGIYRYDASNCNPPLHIVGLPPDTRSLVVLLEQIGTPIAPRTHWICWDLPPAPVIATGETGGINGRNDFLFSSYTGPCLQGSILPYCFLVYALRNILHLPAGATRFQAERSFSSQVLAKGALYFFA